MRRQLTPFIAAVAAFALTAGVPAAVAASPSASAGEAPSSAESSASSASSSSSASSAGASSSASSSATAPVAPSASRNAIKARYGTFKAKTYRGTGTKIVKLPRGATRGLVTIKARGKGTFKAQLLKKNKKTTHGRPIVGKLKAPYQGTTVYGLESTQYDPTYLRIESTSAKKWTVKVQPLHRATALKKKQKGSGDAVFRMTLGKPKTWSVKYRSQIKDNLIVTTYGLTRSQVLVNKIRKKYSGKVKVDDFSGFLVIRSSGSWTVKR